MSKYLGFWKWLYKKVRYGTKDDFILSFSLIMGGLSITSLAFVFSIVVTPFALIGIPIGILVFLYGTYQLNGNSLS